MFKIGDKVKVKRRRSLSSSFLAGRIGIIMSINHTNNYLTLDIEGKDFNGLWFDEVELVSENSELEELVKKANEGYKAIKLINKNYNNQVEIKIVFNGENPDKKWEDLQFECTDLMEYRIKSKVHKFKVANWEAEINGENVKIGCAKFEKINLKFDLNAILNENQSGGYNYHLRSTRTGIYYESSNFISYDTAEKLLKELQK